MTSSVFDNARKQASQAAGGGNWIDEQKDDMVRDQLVFGIVDLRRGNSTFGERWVVSVEPWYENDQDPSGDLSMKATEYRDEFFGALNAELDRLDKAGKDVIIGPCVLIKAKSKAGNRFYDIAEFDEETGKPKLPEGMQPAEEEKPRSRRGRSAPAEEPAPTRRGRTARAQEPEEDEEDEEDEPEATPPVRARSSRTAPTRSRASASAPASRSSRSRSQEPEDDEEDEEPEERPARTRSRARSSNDDKESHTSRRSRG